MCGHFRQMAAYFHERLTDENGRGIEKYKAGKRGGRVMAGVKWTENQLDAINARKGAVLVSAAAGSGKTAVLVERVIDMITDPVSPVDADRFLVVTYTRAAAGEMKERISARLDELLREDPFNENLRRQQMLLTKAQIPDSPLFPQISGLF